MHLPQFSTLHTANNFTFYRGSPPSFRRARAKEMP